MPSKYVAKKPRGSKFKNTPEMVLFEQARARANEIHAARLRCVMAKIKRLLRGQSQHACIDAICYYMQLDELESVATDLAAKQRSSNALAAQNRARQAS